MGTRRQGKHSEPHTADTCCLLSVSAPRLASWLYSCFFTQALFGGSKNSFPKCIFETDQFTREIRQRSSGPTTLVATGLSSTRQRSVEEKSPARAFPRTMCTSKKFSLIAEAENPVLALTFCLSIHAQK